MQVARSIDILSQPPQSIMDHSNDDINSQMTKPIVDQSQLDWLEKKLSTMQIQQDNLNTLINIWSSIKDNQETNLKWGDEIEYALLKLDHESRKVEVAPEGAHVIEQLSMDKSDSAVDIQREAYEYMVETSPTKPYSSDLQQLAKVEQDMQYRREAIQNQLSSQTSVFSLSRFGMFGAADSNHPNCAATSDSAKKHASSLITGGARYRPVLEGTKKRRGYSMNGEAALYTSPSTSSLASSSTDSLSTSSSSAESVLVDDPIYAMGGCAVQANFGAANLADALAMHDQFCPIGPLMLALTAASPILKGYLVSADARWNHCAQAVDDRSIEESHLNPRWGTAPMYFEDKPSVQALNSSLPSSSLSTEFRGTLLNSNLPTPLATYFAHALSRNPMLHPKALPGGTSDGDLNDPITRLKTQLASLWPHIRLKLASPDSSVPWIVEFRSMETQLTDFEIAAVVVFLKLLQQTIQYFGLELRVPMQKVDENMRRAQVADAVTEQRFWFNVSNSLKKPAVRELSLDEIFNGQAKTTTTENVEAKPYPGLLHYIRTYLSIQIQKQTQPDLTEQEIHKLNTYIDFMARRASGVEPTPAKWMREFVLGHEAYKGDSRVPESVYYDMMCAVKERSL